MISVLRIMQTKSLNIHEILAPITPCMLRVNDYIHHAMASEVDLINQISQHIIDSGGKRLRPASVVMCAAAIAPDKINDITASENNFFHNAVRLAAVVEFIHTATLLHDDVVDDSHMRRGKKTANNVWGNSASVLSGDFLYSRAFQMMTETADLRIIKLLCDTTNRIAEGEVMQLLNIQNMDITEQEYFTTVECKTAVLFAAACQLGAITMNATTEQEQALNQYGFNLGVAFQLVDDILDYTGDSQSMGKNLGDDIQEGKITLPLLYTIETVGTEDKAIIEDAIINGNMENLSTIIALIKTNGGIEKTQAIAENNIAIAKKAIDCIESSQYKETLIDLASFTIARTY